MLKALKDKNRLRETVFIGVMSILCISFSFFRISYTGTKIFMFLNWNLFLALIPWFLTSFVITHPNIRKKKFTVFFLMGFWLLFFPNAPYILTDLFHLRFIQSMPIWFDMILILSFAWTGLLSGLLSLWDIEKILGQFMNRVFVTIISASLLFLGSFGIYIGRYLRWNSWDIISEPFRLIYDIGDRFINPFNHPRTWGMTLFLGIFLNMIYWSFRLIRKRPD